MRTGPEPGRNRAAGTQLAVVVHQDDLMQQVGGASVQNAVDGSEQSGRRLVEEADHYAGGRQRRRVRLLTAPGNGSEPGQNRDR